ncbi:MAG: sigma-54-dependent Fis family transcriptional regulator [Chromatiales bacterium]|nr:sigma-54-dependent Fis family transcriptional regulator [Gammaproteobacteria bacterium]MCP5351976.1 sigma-54-dependent Fis family transcriptional regulator [Chromatiales bacterium]
MSNPLALVVDDEPDILELVELTLGRMDIDCKTAENVTEAKSLLSSSHFDVCLTDMKLPDGDGISLVRYIQEQYPNLPVAVITAHGNMELAVEALKAGAFDFVSKPVNLTMLRNLVNTALKLTKEGGGSGGGSSGKRSRSNLIGTSTAMERTRATIAKLARSQAPVYISGESGVGKELVARMIHESGPRVSGPFIPVNCGAIPSDLMESEFFGHRKGSFTGASYDKEGLFTAASGGTLFLDEVAELPLPMQVKLLRAIQERAVRPVGGNREVPVDVRILSATHKNLARQVEEGHFRQDLYYRINVIELPVPPLRERREDIPLLAEFFLDRLSGGEASLRPKLAPDAVDALDRYGFPGNIRELENILERAMTLCEDNIVRADDLQLTVPVKIQRDDEEDFADDQFDDGADLPVPDDLPQYLDDMEKQVITKALEEARYNKTLAAKRLGITFRALRYRLKKLGLE